MIKVNDRFDFWVSVFEFCSVFDKSGSPWRKGKVLFFFDQNVSSDNLIDPTLLDLHSAIQ